MKAYENIDNDDWDSKLSYYKQLDQANKQENAECSEDLFIEPTDWIMNSLESDLKGKVSYGIFGKIYGIFFVLIIEL